MKRFLLSVLFAIFMVSASHAREIWGAVVSDTDSLPVSGALCELRLEGKVVSEVNTGEKGMFSFSIDGKQPLELKISKAGFSPTEIVVESGSGNLNLGIVILSKGMVLEELTVSGRTDFESDGRTIVFPSKADVKASSTSICLLQKLPLPGLDVNMANRTLTVDGGSPVILINGLPSDITDVHSIHPKDIEKIEYSKVTPARYADKGASGMVSIILRKRNDGGSLYAWGRSAVTTAFVDANIRASYHQGPSQFSLSYRPSWRNYQAVYDDDRQSFIGNDFKVELDQRDRNPFNYLTNGMQLKYQWSPDMETLFSATFNASVFSDKRRKFGHIYDSHLGEYDNSSLSKSKQFTPSLDLFFRRDFNSRNSLEVQVVGTLSSDDYRWKDVYEYPDGTETPYEMDVDNRRRSLISEISYIHSFSERTSLSGGYQNTLSYTTNKYLLSGYKPVLTENNNYIYARIGQQAGPVYFSIATGAKLYWVENDLNKRHFIRNLTTAQISWNISRKWNMGAAFRYSPYIPSLASLTDHPQQTSPYLITNGNAELKVADYLTFQVAPTYRHNKISASLMFTYRHAANPVISDMVYMGDRLFLQQSLNADRVNYFCGVASFRISDVAGFGANASLSVDHTDFAGVDWNNRLTSVSGSVTLWWNKGPFTVSYWRKFPGKYLNGHYEGKEENGDALSLEYKLNAHFTIGVDWMYMFDSKGTRYPSWNYSIVNPAVNDRYIKNNSNMIVFTLSYTTDFGTIFRSVRRNLNNSDNESSLMKM